MTTPDAARAQATPLTAEADVLALLNAHDGFRGEIRDGQWFYYCDGEDCDVAVRMLDLTPPTGDVDPGAWHRAHQAEVIARARATTAPEQPWRIGGYLVTRQDYLAMTRALEFGGDGFDDPAATPAQMLPMLQEWARDAAEWREHERWRVDCYLAGHPDDEDCHEHNPHLATAATRADTPAEVRHGE